METNKKIKVILEKTNTGYSAYAPEVDGIYTAGEDLSEIKKNLDEVIEIQADYLQEQGHNEQAIALRKAEVSLFLDVKQFFEHYYMLNKTAFAKYIGMNQSHLRKISKGIMPLSDAKATQIQNGLQKLASELQTVHFV